jgi:predicted transcriptional regulator
MITIFKNLADTSTPFYRDIIHVLNRIKEGKSKELIEKIRKGEDLKKQLPAICFCGTFKHRSDASIIEHSGYVCLDFDKYTDAKSLAADRKKIEADKYTFSVFTSPSGNGMKVIVKIPKEPENHKRYFDALEKHYNNQHFDVSSKNISRICFESYDPKIYINEFSDLWETKEEYVGYDYREKPPLVKLENENEIIKRLYKWFCKDHSMTEGARNSNLFILVSSFSDYGISDLETARFCNQFIQPDFTKVEIEKVIRSAYSKGAKNFGMKFFEDNDKLEDIKKIVKIGATEKEIKEKYPNVDTASLTDIKEEIQQNTFWRFAPKNRIILDHLMYKNWLESNGFYKYYPEGSDSYIFVKVTNNLIDNTSDVKIKDFVLTELLKIKELKVYEHMAGNPKYFKEDYLNILSETNIFFKDDTIDTAYIYFNNKAVKVTKDGFELIDYIDLDGFVWKKHIIDFDFKHIEDVECDFSKFIDLISGKEQEKVNAITSTMGYLMHSFKTSANNKAIILNDETISENPNGGSGKGIFWNALSKVKRVSDVNGKSFSFEKSFPYQTVSADTQILVFDDVQKNFKFENLFSVITEGITLEKKNKDAIKIPVSKSPKIIITTNYTLGGVGGSFERRKLELEFSSYFSSKHTPLNEFGRMLFDEWDYAEWLRFYNYMLKCLQMYLVNGLIQYDYKNLETRKFIKESSFEFYEWATEETIKINERINKSSLFDLFINDFPDYKNGQFKLTHKRFFMWVDKYCDFNGYEIEKGQDSMGQRYIEVKKV